MCGGMGRVFTGRLGNGFEGDGTRGSRVRVREWGVFVVVVEVVGGMREGSGQWIVGRVRVGV